MNPLISIDPRIQHGKPTITGTRVPVTRIIGGLAGGMSRDEILSEYEISEEQFRAALEFAAGLLEEEQFHPLPAPAP